VPAPALKTRITSLGPKTEFAIVTAVAFGLFILNGVRHLLFAYGRPAITAGHLDGLIIFEVLIFSGLYWFLRQRNWTAERAGAVASLSDVPVGVGLSLVAYVAFLVTWMLIAVLMPSAVAAHGAPPLVGGQFDLLTVLLASIVNPIFEETFLCGYVVTALTPGRSAATAVSVSMVIRLLCHLYQGPLAVGIVPVGLVFTWYYVRTHRLWPVVIAHAVFDFVGLVPYT
jgi:membrane protease YdiL (CAAX protease family)